MAMNRMAAIAIAIDIIAACFNRREGINLLKIGIRMRRGLNQFNIIAIA